VLARFLGWFNGPAYVCAAGVMVGLPYLAHAARSAVATPDGEQREARWFLWLGLVMVVGVPLLVSLTVEPIYLLRYVIPAAPLVYLLVADGLLSQPGAWWRRLGVVACLGLSLAGTGVYLSGPHRPDWRAAARHLAGETRPGDVIWVAPGSHSGALEWYYDGPARVCPRFHPKDRRASELPAACNQGVRLWVVAMDGIRRREPGILADAVQLLAKGWREVIVPPMHGINLRRYDSPIRRNPHQRRDAETQR